MQSINTRSRFEAALNGGPVTRPVYAVYDWFVQNRPIDWPGLFRLGLGQIHHATLVDLELPHASITESRSVQEGRVRRDVYWHTDLGDLHEWYLGEWRQEYLIKSPADYRIMARALESARLQPRPDAFARCERNAADGGITIAVPGLRRTAMQVLQIDYVGLERFALDLAGDLPELLDLAVRMDDLLVKQFEAMAAMPMVRDIKLWENLSIETIGPRFFRRHLVPTYRRLLDVTSRAGQRLCLHYDGKLGVIAPDIAVLGFDGVDSFTEAPEGDMTVAAARGAWPDKFLWLHPNLGWFDLPVDQLVARIRRVCREAGPSRFCLMISEEVPPNWQTHVPAVLEALQA